MKRGLHLALVLVFTLNLTYLSFAQLETEERGPSINLKPALGFEFFSRTISWNGEDENSYSSELKSYLCTLNMEFEIQESLFLSLLLGYSSSNYDEMTFRELPISVELDVGGISGFLFGGEINKNLISSGDFGIGLLGQFVFCLGIKNEWEIPGLAVTGKVEGNPTWMRAAVGPFFSYHILNYFYPYLFFGFNYLWGSFKMEETIQSLEGSENKKFSAEALIGISLGAIYEITDKISLKGEVSVHPYKENIDFGFMIKVAYVF